MREGKSGKRERVFHWVLDTSQAAIISIFIVSLGGRFLRMPPDLPARLSAGWAWAELSLIILLLLISRFHFSSGSYANRQVCTIRLKIVVLRSRCKITCHSAFYFDVEINWSFLSGSEC